ncbi:MAG: hypothetical protein EHM67_03520 [Hyphomicrobiaceae bacterium]|nr:MAG: hypothetical protein EHM67_03520 [Hyphomicrobiaceae bacterium]
MSDSGPEKGGEVDVARELRNCAADVHARDCMAHHAPCSCGLLGRCGDMMREAAARIEVAIEALNLSNKTAEERIFIARYALTAERKAP